MDEKLVAAALEALAEARRRDDAAELARDAARRGIGLDDRGAAALVRAFRRSGDWQGALDLPVVGPLSAHAAVEACRAGASSAAGRERCKSSRAWRRRRLRARTAAAACDAEAAAVGAVVGALARAWASGVFPAPGWGRRRRRRLDRGRRARDDRPLSLVSSLPPPLRLDSRFTGECGDALGRRRDSSLTGDEDLKPHVSRCGQIIIRPLDGARARFACFADGATANAIGGACGAWGGGAGVLRR